MAGRRGVPAHENTFFSPDAPATQRSQKKKTVKIRDLKKNSKTLGESI